MVSNVQRQKYSVHIIHAKAAAATVAAAAAVAAALGLWPAGLVGTGLLKAYFSISECQAETSPIVIRSIPLTLAWLSLPPQGRISL